jgi:tetratricopeptide (TPR) repeat protein
MSGRSGATGVTENSDWCCVKTFLRYEVAGSTGTPHHQTARNQVIEKPAKSSKTTKAAKIAKAGQPPTPAALRTTGEQAMRDVQKALATQSFANIGDVNAFLQSLMGPGLKHSQRDAAPPSPKDEAQELAFAAMEAETEAQARKLAKQALAKDPDCVDALVILADLDTRTLKETVAALQNAVAAGERSLGEKFFKENKGHFWLILETRPYMRALEHLATVLRARGSNLEAIKNYEKMIGLNPGDNQGVRDPLLGLYLATGKLEGARKLHDDYGDDSMANFAWGRVLERFLSGDKPGAVAALKKARKANPFVELYLSGRRNLPKGMPDMYSPGSNSKWGSSEASSAVPPGGRSRK